MRRTTVADGGVACSLLKLLEKTALELLAQPPEATAKWLQILIQYSLVEAANPAGCAWIVDPAFRSYLARGTSLADSADKGLW